MIYSATYGTEPGATVDPRVIRQIAYAAAGIGVMVVLVGLDYRLLANLAGPLYAGAIAALLVVLVLGALALLLTGAVQLS
jgi:cell division protein FtsW (lipid II flippase)